jgi:hypothetical protein
VSYRIGVSRPRQLYSRVSETGSGKGWRSPPPEMPEMFRDVYYHSLDAPTMLQIAEKTTVTMERRLGVQLRLSTV